MPISNYIPSSRLIQPGVCTSTTRPASPYNGQVIYETDTTKTLVYNGSSWVALTAATTTADVSPGLVYIASASATSGSYLDILSCFSSTYTNYLVNIDNAVASGTCGVQIALTTGSTPTLNAANWLWGQARPDFAANTFSYTKEENSSYGNQVCIAITSNPTAGKAEIFRPNKTTYTTVTSTGQDGRGSTGYLPLVATGTLQNTTAYTGLRVAFIGQTITSLSVRVYGYKE